MANHKAGGTPPAPWDPSQDTVLAVLWWDANVFTGTGSTLKITDRYLNGYDLIVPSGVTPPTILTGAYNGQNAIKFDGSTNNRLATATAKAPYSKTDDHTVLVVSKGRSAVTSGNFGTFATFGTDTVGLTMNAFFAANVAGYNILNMGGGDALNDTGTGATSFDYTSALFSILDLYSGSSLTTGANHDFRKDGVSVTLSDFAGAVNTAETTTGLGAYGVNGLNADWDICEVIVWKKKQDAATISKIYTYLHNKYGTSPASALQPAVAPVIPWYGTFRYGMKQQLRWGKIAAIAAPAAAAIGSLWYLLA